MPGRYYIKTFGCQMNEYDSTKMGEVLAAAEGLVPRRQRSVADILLMNTCSVRDKAEDKVYSLLGTWRLLKAQRPEVIIGVGGCVASQEGDAITARAPYVDLVFGPQTIHRLPQLLADLRRTGKSQIDVSFPEIEKFDHLPPPRATGASAFVSIMEGCSKFCSYCVVPYTRGEEVSRPAASVLEEVRALVAQGVGEITLLGQNVNAYEGPRPGAAPMDLGQLIRAISAMPGVERVRFTTSHPLNFGDTLIEAFAHTRKLANHLHLPGAERFGPHPGADAAWVHGAGVQAEAAAPQGRAAGYHGFHRPDRGLSRRDRARFPAHAGPYRRSRLRPVFQLHLQPAPRNASGFTAR